jgi:hypothetical protein
MIQPSLNRSRNDKFILVLDLPTAMKKKYDETSDKFFSIEPLQLSIFGSPVPQISVPSLSVPFGGQVHKISSMSRPEYNPLTIKFLVDNGYKNYWVLWNWMNLFNDAQKSLSEITKGTDLLNTNIKDPYIKNPVREYVSIFTIYGLDEYNNKIISFEYNNAFPTNLGELNFSNQDPSEINCSVTFSFNQLRVNLVKNVDDSSSCST